MLPLSRSRSRLSTQDEPAESPSRPSGFSRLMQRVSPGSRLASGRNTNEVYAQRERDEYESPARLRRPSDSRREPEGTASPRQRASTSSPTGYEPRLASRSEYLQPTQESMTPSPARNQHYTYTSSPSPLARRSESRQSLRVHQSDDDGRPPSRARTPKPRDYHPEHDSFESSEDDEQATTPRKSEIRRWVPSSVTKEDTRARYSSEPPPSVESATRETYRPSMGHRLRGADPEPRDKVERWMAGDEFLGEGRRRSALPTEFRVSHSRSQSSLSQYSDIPDSPHPPPARESPFRRSESLHLAAVLDSQPPQSPTVSIRRSATLHATGSPLRSRLGPGSVRSSAESEVPSSPVDLQRAESRRRRAALLEEMATPLRPVGRVHATTETRPTSRMSNATYIRPSTSMSSFRGDGLGPERRFRRESARPMSVTSGGDAWPASYVPRPRNGQGPEKTNGRISPTRSTVSSGIVPPGTPSRAIINRLLASLRAPSSNETQEMIHACITLQETLATRSSEGDLAFKQSCQVIATDANQIHVNLQKALAIIAQSSMECEQAASPEEAQIGAIAALQTLGELVASSSRASEEKIKSLQDMFAQLSTREQGVSGVGRAQALPSVREDDGVIDGERVVENPVERVVEKPVEREVGTTTEVSPVDVTNVPEGSGSTGEENSEVQLAMSAEDEASPAVAPPAQSKQADPAPQGEALSESFSEPTTSDPVLEAPPSVPPPSADITEVIRTRTRKASSSSISVSLSPSNSFKVNRSPVPPSLTHKASFMPSSLSMRTPTTALSRINVGSADEPGFDFDIKPKAETVKEEPVQEDSSEVSAQQPALEQSTEEEAPKVSAAEATKEPLTEAFRLNPLQLEIQTTPSAGRGVFATDDIPAQTIVEESPVLVLTKKEWDDGHLNDGVLGGYGFNWTAGGMGVGLGIASMFNHSPQPNVMFTRVAPPVSEPHQYPKLVFHTTKPIKKGDELYICYSADESKLWFSPDYKKDEDDVDYNADEPEWIAPMCDEEEDEQPPTKKDPVLAQDRTDSSRSSATAVAPTAAAAQITDGTGDQKYHDRKARKQSKREKKVKKPTPDVGAKQDATEVVSDKPTDIPSSKAEPSVLDATSSLSPSEYAAALAKLTLIPVIAVDDGDVEQEKVLEKASSSAAQLEKGSAWCLVKRIRGPVEAQGNDGNRTVEIWAVSIADKKLVPSVLKYLRLNEKRFLALDHVKRVNHQKDEGRILVAIAPTTTITHDSLRSELTEFNPSLAECEILQTTVPATYATDLADVAEKAKLWPVLLDAAPQNPADSPWTVTRKAWVRRGVKRIYELAQKAKDAGELPVAAIASSAPEGALPSDPDMIPPTPNMRASATDRRTSLKHPLKHAAMECVAEIARLRTQSPFTETMSARNGADYLLTSLSLFITHEPCVMCTMALLHSRVKEIFFLVRNPEGGFGGAFAIHGHPGLNHKIDVYDCSRLVQEADLARLRLPEATEP